LVLCVVGAATGAVTELLGGGLLGAWQARLESCREVCMRCGEQRRMRTYLAEEQQLPGRRFPKQIQKLSGW
jgi:hypothetical protein